MKTKFALVGLTALFLVACDKKQTESSFTAQKIDLGANPFFLTTDLPQERIEGTPAPIRVRGVNHIPVAPSETSSPGTGRVIYRHVEMPPPAEQAAPAPQVAPQTAAQALPQPPPIDRAERPPANLVFLLDVSGSMQPSDRLPLVQRAMHLLAGELQRDARSTRRLSRSSPVVCRTSIPDHKFPAISSSWESRGLTLGDSRL